MTHPFASLALAISFAKLATAASVSHHDCAPANPAEQASKHLQPSVGLGSEATLSPSSNAEKDGPIQRLYSRELRTPEMQSCPPLLLAQSRFAFFMQSTVHAPPVRQPPWPTTCRGTPGLQEARPSGGMFRPPCIRGSHVVATRVEQTWRGRSAGLTGTEVTASSSPASASVVGTDEQALGLAACSPKRT